MWARRMAWGLVALGAALGLIADRASLPPPVTSGGYFVLTADFHVHSFFGDGALAPWDLVGEARRRGLHVVAITNHNRVWPARLARWLSRRLGGPVILLGQEVTAARYHIAAVGIETPVDWTRSAAEAIDAIHAQGGVAIAAHPMAKWTGFDDAALARLDGAERVHPLVFVNPFAYELAEFFARASAIRPGLAAIGSSDFHAASSLGLCRTHVFVTEVSEAGVLEALRAGRTVVHDARGTAHGDPALRKLLPAPIPAGGDAASKPGVGGAFAWVGLVALLLLA